MKYLNPITILFCILPITFAVFMLLFDLITLQFVYQIIRENRLEMLIIELPIIGLIVWANIKVFPYAKIYIVGSKFIPDIGRKEWVGSSLGQRILGYFMVIFFSFVLLSMTFSFGSVLYMILSGQFVIKM